MSFFVAEQSELEFVNYRPSGPKTSRQAGLSVSLRSGSQRHKLLATYAENNLGLTDEEAGIRSGLFDLPKCCYWKRCSELRQLKWIEPTGDTRLSSVQEPQMVCRITQKGFSKLTEATKN